mmetsp:Transcript_47223/g.118966  ORF Transcript_47223/g.118966 Transcript_47223/m.118966 type:complete len:223 (-) Transcript_47223:57-725(-)
MIGFAFALLQCVLLLQGWKCLFVNCGDLLLCFELRAAVCRSLRGSSVQIQLAGSHQLSLLSLEVLAPHRLELVVGERCLHHVSEQAQGFCQLSRGRRASHGSPGAAMPLDASQALLLDALSGTVTELVLDQIDEAWVRGLAHAQEDAVRLVQRHVAHDLDLGFLPNGVRAEEAVRVVEVRLKHLALPRAEAKLVGSSSSGGGACGRRHKSFIGPAPAEAERR